MVSPKVAHHSIHVLKHQRLGIALLIRPAQRAIVNGKLGLRKKPVQSSGLRATCLPKIQSGNTDASIGCASDVELWLVNVELLKSHAPQGAR